MRLDKFLKVSRVIKRRTVGKELALAQRVKVNGRIVKPSYVLSVDDLVELTLGDRIITIKILDLRPFSPKSDVDTMYEVVNETFNKTENV
jgi:ribosomal 50S subunit-recycling heat shock protein